MRTVVRAFAPATVANVAVGFDILGFSFDVTGDVVSIEKTDQPGVVIADLSRNADSISKDATRNTAGAGLLRLIQDQNLSFGFKVSIEKGIPLASGMGGSAASAVASIVAANSFLARPLSSRELLKYALIGEAQASGAAHADNIAPCLLGGLVLAHVAGESVDFTSIPLPPSLFGVPVHPELEVETKSARGVLDAKIFLSAHVQQSANLAAFVAGCFKQDLDLIRRSLKDLVVEPQRAHLIPGFAAVQKRALDHGALGCSISGSGPSVFAWATGAAQAIEIQEAMVEAFNAAGVKSQGWSRSLALSTGARVLS